jgi:hypothetical protein
MSDKPGSKYLPILSPNQTTVYKIVYGKAPLIPTPTKVNKQILYKHRCKEEGMPSTVTQPFQVT